MSESSTGGNPITPAALSTLLDFLVDAEIDHERSAENTVVAKLPGTKKLFTTVSFVVGEHTLSVNAFVCRRPDENHEAVLRFLLEQNRSIPGVSYCLDRLGDIYLIGRLPLRLVDRGALDSLMGSVLTHADGDFNRILELGFRSAIITEWRWRLDRDESTGNLAAFEHLRPDHPTRGGHTQRRGDRGALGDALRQDGTMTDATLILLRHGQSEWNALNQFTGWVDVDVTEKGAAEATAGGGMLADAGVLPDVLHTSVQRRAIHTAELALAAAGRSWIPVRRHWRLNERHYGALQGKNKQQVRDEFGDEQFMLWRRSYDTPPPPIDRDDPHAQFDDPRYGELAPEQLPETECLKDVVGRMLPYWYDAIVPDLRAGRVVLVTAHGNSLRALVKHLDGISDSDIAGLNIPTGIPLVYRLDSSLRPTVSGGEYLDPEAAATAAAAVAAQGQK